VHPSFRVVALGTPPRKNNPYLTAEVAQLFSYISLPDPSVADQLGIVNSVFGDVRSATRSALERFLVESEPEAESSLRLSLRQLVRVASKLHQAILQHGDQDALLTLGDLLHANLLSRFMPIPGRTQKGEGGGGLIWLVWFGVVWPLDRIVCGVSLCFEECISVV
jgi:hypothetical protein